MKTSKSKLIASAACIAIMLSLGTMTAFAAGTENGKGANPSSGERIFCEKSLVRSENGKISYSTDDGENWTEGTPDNFHSQTGENGEMFSWVGDIEPPEIGDGASLFGIKIENGKTLYTIDGENWSETAPDGFSQNADGSVHIKYGTEI